jgi:predicted dehydrogenase
MKTQLRLGIIGATGRGKLADHAHRPDEGVAIVAGADPYADRLDAFRTRYREKFGAEVEGFADYREMLDRARLDGVFVTSPDFRHEEQACEALRRGIAVYLEKPMAITTAECDRILREARARGAKLMLGHNMRYMVFTNRMKELIEGGAIGAVKAIWVRHFISYGGDAYFRDWHAERSKSTSLLLQKGAHDIDIIHWLAGSVTRRVVGFGGLGVYDRLPRRAADATERPDVSFHPDHWPPEAQSGFHPVIEVEDHNMILMELANGVQASYLQCHYTPDACRNYTVIGTRGRIENYGDSGDKCTVELWNRRVDDFRLRGDVSHSAAPPAGGHGGADGKIVRAFVDYVRTGQRPATTPQSARYSVACGCAGAESIRAGGRPIEVPPLPDELEHHLF